MLFNSIEFAIFLPLVFVAYWFLTNRNLQIQNFLILAVSYLFYGWWDWRFLSLIFFSSVIDYTVGIQLARQEKESARKALLAISLVVNLGLLVFFKYYNFFLDSFVESFSALGIQVHASTMQIILPVGISFYTFQTLSYSIDVYRRKLEPCRDLISFFAYVSFFPQLVAGPIERASNLLPQFYTFRKFNYAHASDGMRQILWGMFKKVVIADNCAIFVNTIFDNPQDYSGSTLLVASFLFAFQIYGDFSGYSDIAIGTARVLGFNLMRNFAYPYFSRDIAEFWRRWHISLSTWFRDYLYIPLGGSRGGRWQQIRNTFAIFVVSGFWHGANWTFMFWGFLNALYFLPLLLLKQNRKNLGIAAEGRLIPSFLEVYQILTTFLLTVLAWIFFRAASMGQAFYILGKIFSPTILVRPEYGLNVPLFISIALLLLIEWVQREKLHPLQIEKVAPVWRWTAYLAMINFIAYNGNFVKQQFIYFQF